MQTRAEGILRAVNNNPIGLNILTAPTHESFQGQWESLPHNFYMMQKTGVFKPWNHWSRPVPKNHVLVNETDGPDVHVKFDIVLSQNKFGQIQHLSRHANGLNIPLISLEHTWPVPSWPQEHLEQIKSQCGDLNVFISAESARAWGWDLDDKTVRIVRHGIDANVFTPDPSIKRVKHVLTVANDYINRDWCLGFKIYQRVTQGLPVHPRGDTAGLSTRTSSTEELIGEYRRAGVFLNTSTHSPIPMSLIEAASCACPIVTNDTCACGDLITNGYNGFITKNEKEMRWALEFLLNNEEEAEEMGRMARETVLQKFSLENHLQAWNDIFKEAYGVVRNQWD